MFKKVNNIDIYIATYFVGVSRTACKNIFLVDKVLNKKSMKHLKNI